ncbi:phosphate regulon transcriptional regulatory protein PhoB [Notoacmeibacter marinus]|uniref:Phosphate regulon transcriptional regulatory protein PhoB n=1 Tax=Notoacmeibacter marinus TaxID=1876515 RepID=A0A231UWW8_9HYPH|nr:phosphate regulon transcriptional regulator PhoB [Notoacmeibacter marinus]OXT00449.1 phosphate regulon transcriptional regulatory protein PhoB [Notoacmeibacter marinus]
MGSRASILVVEDEPAQREVLRYNLVAEGFDVVLAETGDEALEHLAESQPDLVVLDWMLPGPSGIEICRQIKSGRDSRNTPVIMLSARTEEGDRVRGLDIGADDYITKPFSVAELIARIRKELRRTHPVAVGERIEHDDLVLDAGRHLVERDGQRISLSTTEFRLLSVLIERPGRVFSREQLLNRVWGHDLDVETRTVDVHVGRLRKALRRHGGDDPIRTVRGEGYALG